MTPIIRVENLAKSFGGDRVFESVSFDVQPGRHFALLGPSGCGKSTLLRLLAGLEAPGDGKIWIDGRLASDGSEMRVPPHERQIGMVFQDLALWPSLSVFENVTLGLARAGLAYRERCERAFEALNVCKVGELAKRKPETLSIGQQQRVAMARAVAVRPKLLLLDEPFSSLDPFVKTGLLDEVQMLTDHYQITLVLVTHDLSEALKLCGEGLVIEGSVVKEAGELSTMLTTPESSFMKACIAQFNSISSVLDSG